MIIKNMVCPRCITAVKSVLQDIGATVLDVKLGKATIDKSLTKEQTKTLKSKLRTLGFELLDNKRAKIINAIKATIIKEIYNPTGKLPINYSLILSKGLKYDYAYLSRLFSAVEGRTIEKFIMAQKVERVKELLTYDEMSLSEIAFEMKYSSSAHLSSQFKKVTGMSPSVFKKMQKQDRKGIDKV